MDYVLRSVYADACRFQLPSLVARVTLLSLVGGRRRHLPYWEIYVLLLGRKRGRRELFLPQMPSAQNNRYAKAAYVDDVS